MNYAPCLSEIATDDFYTTDAGFTAESPMVQDTYSWNGRIYYGDTSPDWDRPYQQVFYANVVLEGLRTVNPDTASLKQYNQVKGSALFYRAFAFYNLAQQFALPYDAATAGSTAGIPLRLDPDINTKTVRASLQQTYDQITGDLKQSIPLLPGVADYKTRPSKPAALALLARVYQTMGQYEDALGYADSCLAMNSSLIDYNTLTTSATRPLPKSLPNGNDEVLFHAVLTFSAFLSSSATTIIDTVLYRSYEAADLRKAAFFRDRGNGVINFKGSYTGTYDVFAGLATDEVYLIRAECYARLGRTAEAMSGLNLLRRKRWDNGVAFTALAASDPEQALALVFSERRKELVYRNLRWTDLRRLNKDPRFCKTLRRVVKGVEYTLPPGDPRYAFPIPDNVIALGGIEQNAR